MEIFLCLFIACLFTVYVFNFATRAPEPEFTTRGVLSGDKLRYAMSALAYESKKTETGRGIGVKKIAEKAKSALKKIQLRLDKGEKPQPCEIAYYNNFYYLQAVLGKVRRLGVRMRGLPHVNGIPRIYSFCELLVKSAGGAVDENTVKSAVKSYSAQTPLTFSELTSLNTALQIALCEYLAIYATNAALTGGLISKGNSDYESGTFSGDLLNSDGYLYGLTRGGKRSVNGLNIQDVSERTDRFIAVSAQYNAKITAAFKSLNNISGFITDEFICTLSDAYELLTLGDKDFDKLSQSTKFEYLHNIDVAAKKQNITEKKLAAQVLYRAETENKDIAHYILPSVKPRSSQILYIVFVTLLWTISAIAVSFTIPAIGWLYALIMQPVLLFAITFIIGKISKYSFKRRYLPSYDVKFLNRQNHSTAILTPCLVKSKQDIADAFRHLQTVAAANPENIFCYCLLIDYPKSNEQTAETDAELNAEIKRIFKSVNNGRFCVFVRKRKQVAGEKYYQGYEKKRGAVLDFNEFALSGNGDFALRLGNLPKVRYAVTLDSDTLTNGCAELVATKIHPYCADAAILSVNCKAADKSSLYANLYAGETGPGRYRRERANIAFDVFGVGNYTGKGVYNIAQFNKALYSFFPDNRILSHDFIEGGVGGCYDTSVNASEDFPQKFADDFARGQRWLRGDWQLLPYILPKVKNKEGKKIKNPLCPAASFSIFQNLILSLVPVAQMLLLFITAFLRVRWWGVVLAFTPQILRTVASLFSVLRYGKQTALEFARCAFEVCVLPAVALYKLCAVTVTLYRLARKKKLLEWSVFAHTKGSFSVVANVVAAVLFLVGGLFMWRGYFFLCGAFATGCVLPFALNSVKTKKVSSPSFKFALTDTAKKTFAYFKAQENLYRLPCDCFQQDGERGWCARTSPTNIGMALVAYVSAYELGIIKREKLTAYIKKIVTAVESCEKYKGNLYNWYDCKTLQVLPRRFVSTVDSGNFLTSLCLVSVYTEGELKKRVLALINNTDLSALYDTRRKLFYIGYDDEVKSHTYNHYDLLGSESTLTYLVACGYNKIDKSAYDNLNRQAVKYKNALTVFSWTGGAFEYLMCRLFFHPGDNTLLGQAMRGAVKAQIEYASFKQSNVFGVSECRYDEYDDMGGNLYRAFGVPYIAHGSVPENHPYAPYAAFLTLPYCGEQEFLRCIGAYAACGCEGDWGYCESLSGNTPIKSYMTHHQGMIMAACANALKDDCICTALQSLPELRAALMLCGEEKAEIAQRKKIYTTAAQENIEDCGVYLCGSQLLYAVASGRENYLQYAEKRLIQNIKLYAYDGELTELTDGEFYSGAGAVWKKTTDDFTCEIELRVVPSPLSVIITLTYRNITSSEREVEFYCTYEPVMAKKQDYDSHPAYSKMFIECGAEKDYVWCRRRNDNVTVVHCVADGCTVNYSANKCEFYGRGRSSDFGQNVNPMIIAKTVAVVTAGKAYKNHQSILIAETTDKIDGGVKLLQAENFADGSLGASESLARNVSVNARKIALRLLNNDYDGFKLPETTFAPVVPYELNDKNINNISDYLADIKTLYRAGFGFDAVFFAKKQSGEYYSAATAEREIENSGIKAYGNAVCVLCEEDVYKRLKTLNSKEADDKMLAMSDIIRQFSDLNCVCDNHSVSTERFAPPQIIHKCGIGGFTSDYSYRVDFDGCDTPSPWCNIIADGNFGTLISAGGGGYTFGENSRQQKITQWCNDPIDEAASEFVAFGIDGKFVGATKLPLNSNAKYTAVHSFGYTDFYCEYDGISAKTRVFIVRGESQKVYEVEIFNSSADDVEILTLFAVKPVLGDFGFNTLSTLSAQPNEYGLELHCEQSGCNAYLQCDNKTVAVGVDVDSGVTLYGELGKNRDYWGITCAVNIESGKAVTLRFGISSEHSELICDENSFYKSVAFYDSLSKITFDGEYGYLSKWLPYQVYNGRFAGRVGFYQVSGAYGFRDQLQDCLTLTYSLPQLVREHILLCAKHQFKEGDVMHWWHPPAIGVRTHVCDDRLWLVYVTCEYIAVTGDSGILFESVPFLRDVPISPTDASVYTSAAYTAEKESLLNHCLRAIKISCDFGENGLVRMRGGDWNDAMDKVGERGIGTSVWCSMFLYHVIQRFLPHVKDIDTVASLRNICRELNAAVTNSYCANRFLRAVTDDGVVLGSPDSDSCKIDLLTQSWSVISGVGTQQQKINALNTAYNILCDADSKIIKLFDPPFTSPQGVGYIGNYPEYVRENGGQYTQAAIWYVWALFAAGQTDRANELLGWLSPAHRCADKESVTKYCVEPYVAVADIYGGEMAGKGGWSWYTGSASWLYKCLLEKYLGITVRGSTVTFEPRLPQSTPEINVTFEYNRTRIEVKIINSTQGENWRVRIGGVTYNTNALKLDKNLAGKKITVSRV